MQKNQKYDIPFDYGFTIGTGEGKILQASPNQQILLINVGLKIATVLYGDIAIPPPFQKSVGILWSQKHISIHIGLIYYQGEK